jgi:hypothetical protein
MNTFFSGARCSICSQFTDKILNFRFSISNVYREQIFDWGFFCSAPQDFVVLVLGVFCAHFPPRASGRPVKIFQFSILIDTRD